MSDHLTTDSSVSTDMGTGADGPELVYVSWGGTGRGSTLRKALDRAAETHRGLIYLAILDDGAFGDVDRAMLDLAKDELAWLLDAQLELTRKQTGLTDIHVRVLVRAGDVAAEIVEAVDTTGATEVLLGAPIPEGAENAVAELVTHLESRLNATVAVIEP